MPPLPPFSPLCVWDRTPPPRTDDRWVWCVCVGDGGGARPGIGGETNPPFPRIPLPRDPLPTPGCICSRVGCARSPLPPTRRGASAPVGVHLLRGGEEEGPTVCAIVHPLSKRDWSHTPRIEAHLATSVEKGGREGKVEHKEKAHAKREPRRPGAWSRGRHAKDRRKVSRNHARDAPRKMHVDVERVLENEPEP
eukprot:scaffold431_cov334-Pavlova_lutheri.AAC.66